MKQTKECLKDCNLIDFMTGRSCSFNDLVIVCFCDYFDCLYREKSHMVQYIVIVSGDNGSGSKRHKSPNDRMFACRDWESVFYMSCFLAVGRFD